MRCCSKALIQGFLSWFCWSRDAAVNYWTKGFYHNFPDRGMLMMETFGSVTYCRTLDQGNHGRNPWFSTLLQQPSIKEIMIETQGCCSKILDEGFLSWFPWSMDAAARSEPRVSIMISLIEGCCSKVLNQGFLPWSSLDQENYDKNPWFSNLLQHPSTNKIMIEILGSIPYCSIPRSRKSW
jgi:hypothetical protein